MEKARKPLAAGFSKLECSLTAMFDQYAATASRTSSPFLPRILSISSRISNCLSSLTKPGEIFAAQAGDRGRRRGDLVVLHAQHFAHRIDHDADRLAARLAAP